MRKIGLLALVMIPVMLIGQKQNRISLDAQYVYIHNYWVPIVDYNRTRGIQNNAIGMRLNYQRKNILYFLGFQKENQEVINTRKYYIAAWAIKERRVLNSFLTAEIGIKKNIVEYKGFSFGWYSSLGISKPHKSQYFTTLQNGVQEENLFDADTVGNKILFTSGFTFSKCMKRLNFSLDFSARSALKNINLDDGRNVFVYNAGTALIGSLRFGYFIL